MWLLGVAIALLGVIPLLAVILADRLNRRKVRHVHLAPHHKVNPKVKGTSR